MIKIYLPDRFINDKNIDHIYDRLSQKIYSDQGERKISFTYCGQKKVLDSAAKIKEFLMAKDFYNYKCAQTCEFLRELIKLPGQIKISSIINNNSSSESVHNFCNKFDRKNFAEDYKNLFDHCDLRIKKFKNSADLFELQQYQIFDYTKLQPAERHYILSAMDVPICPYCNMNYTISYAHDVGLKSTADIDHFYLKSEYPEYSLCLYNFIPACPVCNQKFKARKTMTRETHVFPHEDSFKGKSCFHVTNLIDVLLNSQNHAKIELVNQKKDMRVKQSITEFRLNERYEAFSYLAEDLIEKAQIYNETYIKSLSDDIKDLLGSTNVKALIFGANLSEQEYGKISLGKLKQDILNQLGVFK